MYSKILKSRSFKGMTKTLEVSMILEISRVKCNISFMGWYFKGKGNAARMYT